jgi:core-2/I-Branching enzyme
MMMATVITLYKQPQLAEMLLRAMSHPGYHFYLHIDKKVDIKPYEYLFNFPNVFLIKKRFDIKWAGYSMVEALLEGMNQALNSGINYDFINHISGQDYPIKPINQLHDFFEANKDRNFLACETAPSDWWQGAKMRYEDYHFQDSNMPGSYRFAKFLSSILPKRKLPFSYTLYGGLLGAYWTITTDAAQYILRYLEENKKAREFFRKTWGPDEFLFNTLIMNSPFKATVVNNNYRYIDWSEGGWHPKILKVEDFDKLSETQAFFARKFDLTVDRKILELINSKLLS